MSENKQTENQLVPKVVCGALENPVNIAGVDIECYVLENEMRVLSQRGLQRAVGIIEGGRRRGETRLVSFIHRFEEKVAGLQLLSSHLNSPLEFRPLHGGRTAFGYEATILSDICEAILSARKAGLIRSDYQVRIADRCELLMRGFARVGIIALVDKATGYDKVVTKKAYEEILKKYISRELQKYTAIFPDDFYYEIFRLRDWNAANIRKRPGVVGRITVDIVYGRLAPNVLAELKRLSERNKRGQLKNKLYQHLTPDFGHPKLREHLAAVVALMRASSNWRVFYSLINRALPLYNSTLPLLIEYPDDIESEDNAE
jgi:P63C domain